jgi:hypothetical protein
VITNFSYIFILPDDTCTADGDIDTRSLDVHCGSDGPEPNEEQLGRAAQIPDFGLFYNTLDDNIRHRLPLIVLASTKNSVGFKFQCSLQGGEED